MTINPKEILFWTDIFANVFLLDDNQDDPNAKGSITHDDLLFFVSNSDTQVTTNCVPFFVLQCKWFICNDLLIHNEKEKIGVFRRDSKQLPCLTDFSYDWEETVYLNLIMHKVSALSSYIQDQTTIKYLFIIIIELLVFDLHEI